MSSSAAYTFSATPASSSGFASFFRRWFASETIANPHALDEIGLGHVFANYR